MRLPDDEGKSLHEHLIEIGLFIADPAGQSDLVEEVEPGILPTDYINEYAIEGWVRCAFCRRRQRHQHGYTAVLPDGRKALCGSCCGLELFSETHAMLRSRSRGRQQRAAQEWHITRLRAGFRPTMNLVEHWLPIVEEVTAVVRDIEFDLRASGLRPAWGSMDVVKTTEHQVDAIVRGKEVTRTEHIQETIVRVAGSRVFGPKSDLVRANAELAALPPLLWAKKISAKEYKEIGRRKDRAILSIKEAMTFVRAAAEFFTPGNVAALNRWSKHHGGPQVVWWSQQSAPMIWIAMADGHTSRHRVPPLAELPDEEELLRGLRLT